MGFLQQFHLVIRFKKGIYNMVVDMIFGPIVSAAHLLKKIYVLHEIYVEKYAFDNDFQDVYAKLDSRKPSRRIRLPCT